MRKINIFEPSVGAAEADAIRLVLESKWLGRGAKANAFEGRLATILGTSADRLLATNSCTEALFLAYPLFGIGAGDEVLVPSISFPAVGSAVVESGATLKIIDVDPVSGNATVETVLAALSPKTRAVCVTHYGGIPFDVAALATALRGRNITIIEDAACALGSTIDGRACGTLADFGCWSFDAMKLITTGDGGLIWTGTAEHRIEAQERLYLGLPAKAKSGIDKSSDGGAWWEYDLKYPGRRAIFNDIAAAMGLTQLDRIEEFLARRAHIRALYEKELAGLGDLTISPQKDPRCVYSNYFFTVQTSRRDALARFLLEKGVYTTFRYWPLHRIGIFGAQGSFPNADSFAARSLNVPIHQCLTDADLEQIVDAVRAFFKN